MTGEEKEISWEGPEFEYKPKGIGWYWTSILIAALCIGVAAWQKNFLFGLFILIAELLVLVWGNQQPKMLVFAIHEHGVSIGEKVYPYKEIEGFSREERQGFSTQIILKLRKRIRPTLKILAPSEKMEIIKNIMQKNNVEEIEHEPSLIDSIEELTGF